jgi:L,D-transpeptidase ErfK/SrfK
MGWFLLGTIAAVPGLTEPQSVEHSVTLATSLVNADLELPALGSADQYLPSSSMRLQLQLGDRRVYVYRGDTIITSFPVAIGRRGWETPTGEFQVLNVQRDPVWKHPFKGNLIPPGPGNPLGDRWIGFWSDGKNTVGFHGTPHESLIGQAVSHGCVRMRNQDIRALFELVRVGTPVSVKP